MSRINLDDSRIWKPRVTAPTYTHARKELTNNYVIGPNGPSMLFFDPVLGTTTVVLPPIVPGAGQEYYVANLNSGFSLLVQDAVGVFVSPVGPREAALYISHKDGWRVLSPSATNVLGWTSHTVTANFVIPHTASEVFVNRNIAVDGPVTLTLPDAELWYAFHTIPTATLLIVDIFGNMGAPPNDTITINRAGSDLIGSGTSRVINVNFGSWTFRRSIDHRWVTV